MRKSFWYGLVLVALIIPVAVFSAEFRTGDQPSVGVSESIDDDVYMAGGNVTSAGGITGDLFVGGGSVTISGSVGGDITAGGGNIAIFSNVGDDVRVGGGNITIQGKVAGDVIVGGGQVTVGGQGVGGDLVIGGGVVRIDAPVEGGLKAGGGNIYINAPIKGDIIIYDADKVTLGKRAVISGNIKYKSKEELTKEDGAIVNGQVSFEPRTRRQVSPAIFAGLITLWILGKFLMLLVSALVIGLVFRRYIKEAIAKVVERPLLELGRGLVVFAALPVLSVLALFTILGIPFGILGILAFIILMMFAWIVAPVIIGSVVHRYYFKGEMEVSWKTILLGVFIFQILCIIPLLGWLVRAFAVLVALGAIVAIKLKVAREWR